MWPLKIIIFTIYIILPHRVISEDHSALWRWMCEDGKCLKTRTDPKNNDPALSLEACKMFCNEFGLLWPKPTGQVDLGNFLSKVNLQSLNVVNLKRGVSDAMTEAAVQRFKNQVSYGIPKGASPKATGKAVEVYLINGSPDLLEFSLGMDEGYGLRVGGNGAEKINATIFANSFFGLRHGLETLSQLFVYDDIRNHMLMVRDVMIDDKPAYPYRGLLLDTSRNYYTVDSIKRTIDGMAAVKLNTFHWHITDSQSFPFVSERRPNLSRLGALSPSKVYTKSDIKDVVQYGLERGVRVLPEFDAPAHVGEGWQDTNLTVCFKAEPWQHYCVEPPCGQLNPIRDELYEYLEDIYMDMADLFKPDMFHMGGDEVSEKCWNSSAEIQQFILQNRWDLNMTGFLKLWNYFQTKAQDKAYKAFGKGIPLIMWTSTLTDYESVEKYLNKDDYIIQVWTTGESPQIKGLLEKGYRLILSNYDALYLDCGFGAWVGSGNNWCSPYIGWQKVYDNMPSKIAADHKDLILGAEAALWSEQSDTSTLDGRLWPRAAALAERLWSDPQHDWKEAEHRMLHVRERLVHMGIQADSIQPEWCYQNEGYCYN
ncbi:chitooligosaccharidolytic beta-N-acetylglucosaminidase [Amyelois transitella]|uniref:chitooligosaccharidolytic beta-N-acetylglucosaminidase n=1 Tax=Amyelois transitella TaxID=680683 RepID=UPI0029905C14|nr:chitooligosaccharidolytic beta-N-acetylglucosaminidase [Amyelois transitella]XP_013187831.2 chitooligosaccharidolytic beta-N-acetylglucosaminidase [Amyelois transitella]XP_013187832.2 chitooligosaccharidolytic beta-N-acetylglucosaminidase [Amyelois transitella]